MTRMWLKIAGGAALVFLAGLLVVNLVHRASAGVRQAVTGFTVLDDVPHQLGRLALNGVPLGTVNELRIRREQPDSPRTMEINLALSDTGRSALADCAAIGMPVEHLFDSGRTDEARCLSNPAEMGYQQFGQLVTTGPDTLTRPLYAPAAQVQRFSRRDNGQDAEEILIRTDSAAGGARITVTGRNGQKLVEMTADSVHGARIMIRSKNGKPIFSLEADSHGVNIRRP